MQPFYPGILAITCYLLAGGFIYLELKQRNNHKASSLFAWIALISHSFYNYEIFFPSSGSMDFNFFNSCSLIFQIVVLLIMLSDLNKPVLKLGIVVFPLVAIALLFGLSINIEPQQLKTDDWQMNIHILTSIIAFSLLSIAALQACFFALQDRQLKQRKPFKLFRTLPPLQTMESLLFQMIVTGLLFLTISLVSGFIFIEDLFEQHLVHKSVLSIFAWFAFSGLLLGRFSYGWRGRTAINWTLVGFVSLLLAYFGSKLVLELILSP